MRPALVSFFALLHTHPCTHMRTQIHTSTQGPEDILVSVAWLIFSSLFEKRRGVASKAENTWHLSPLGAAMEEGRPRFGEGGGVLKHLVSVWQRQGNCCYWTSKAGHIWLCVCVLTPGRKFLQPGSYFLYFTIIPSSYDNILFTTLILQTQGYNAACRFYVRHHGASQTKAIRQQ